MSTLLIAMSFLLGIGSFAIGSLPLSFTFSKYHLSRLSTLSTGLLLGTALGVIIPEGIETVISTSPNEPPTSTIALSLLFGFILMLIVEQVLAPHSHSPSLSLSNPTPSHLNELEFDAELGDLAPEDTHSRGADTPTHLHHSASGGNEGVTRAVPLTLGLFIHALADGLALGASFLPTGGESPTTGASNESSAETNNNLSFIVFLALLIHKAPTALALTSSLLTTSLSRMECRKHLALFSISTPIGALTSYFLLSYVLNPKTGQNNWTGVALLVSGGTFLYVATVLQPVSGHHGQSHAHVDGVGKSTRVVLICVGMVIPFCLGALFGHGHEQDHPMHI